MLLGGVPVDVGFSIDLTIDPALQALAQRTAACYTGRLGQIHNQMHRAAVRTHPEYADSPWSTRRNTSH